MNSCQNRRTLDLFGIELPIVQAPIAGVTTVEMALAVARAGGLGSLPGEQLSVDQFRAALKEICTSNKGASEHELLRA